MDDTPFYKRPWFYIAGWLAFLLLFYGAQIYRMGGIQASFVDILIDLLLVPMLLVLWMAFFAQFVLPVRTFRDRQKIFDRLITYLFGGHGPALFIENGVIKEHSGERLKKGPGVLWLDSASAAVTRTATAIRQTMGPGVHFIDSREYIAGTIDLHIQSHSMPKESDNPFKPTSEFASEEEYKQVQDRCKQVSALTRDGIEVVPKISVRFRVNTGFPRKGQPGSRFGYRTGVTQKDREDEAQDKDAIRRAILGEGINPIENPDSPRHRVAWNQLPMTLAVDVWREYAAKFTLNELFDPSQEVPASPPQSPQPTDDEIGPLRQPIRVSGARESMQNIFASMLHQINDWMARILVSMEELPAETINPGAAVPSQTSVEQRPGRGETQKKTALQVINDLVKARLTQPEVPVLDDHGQYGQGTIHSKEYDLLKDRGLIVLGVGIGGLMFDPRIEDIIIKNWSTNWLKNAKNESDQIARKKNATQLAAREKAFMDYADMISNEIVQKRPQGLKNTLRTLLMRTRTIIFRNDVLRRNMTTEQQDLEEIIKWIEVNGS
jgi:hypothetical protein